MTTDGICIDEGENTRSLIPADEIGSDSVNFGEFVPAPPYLALDP